MEGVPREGGFPVDCKRALLTKNPLEASSNRSISLLDTAEKLFDYVIKALQSIERKGRAVGVPARSTVSAVERVIQLVRFTSKRFWRTREHCVLITVDTKNAFNSANSKEIVRELQIRRVSFYLV